MKSILVLLFCSFSILAFAQTKPKQSIHYVMAKKIPIKGDERWDYLQTDSAERRLYVSRFNHVSVYDLDTFAVVGEITGLFGVHGIAIAPKLKRGFITNGETATVTVFDLSTLKTLGEIKTGCNSF